MDDMHVKSMKKFLVPVGSNIKYKLTNSCWGKEEIKSLQNVINSGNFTLGKKVRQFETEFANYHKKKYAIMVNSGSSANLAAVAALFFKKNNPLKKGDEVIVPALSWSTSYFPLQQYGLKCKFIDINKDSLNIDVDQMKKAITKKTKLIMAVNILGNPCEIQEIKKICKQKNIYLFEDNCESLDAEVNGKKAGTFGEIGTFSFFYSHHINAMEGGMIITDSKEIANLCLSIRAHGWTRHSFNTSVQKKNNLIEIYDFIYPGYNLKPLELSAACGLEQLRKLPKMTETRRQNLKFFEELFGNDKRFIIQKQHGKSSSFSFPIILKKESRFTRNKILKALKKSGIEYRMITGGCFTRHKVIKFFKNTEIYGSLENANYAHDWGFCVGNQPNDISTELKYLKKVLDEALS